ncbi:PTS glucitol/sorbitol transporter subunit IIC [Klebsiella aerogenes]|uniref:PTS glucitol/sorbitol transporter subunit IIC n=1 Tax=Klebsiella aerogenes TaxID=548 RepID=UPI0018691176|nr:PTS glucitol/sorbitol transporter subunit IIC [Klebsiella aerogenes]
MELLSLTGSIIPVIRNASTHFVTLTVTVLPAFLLLRILLTVTLRLAGTARAEGLAQVFGRSRWLTYGVLPVAGWLLLRAPGALALGIMLPEKHKPGFADALTTLSHPLSTAFPTVVTPELVAWFSITAGLRAHGLPVSGLALRYLMVAVLIGLVRGMVTEWIFLQLISRRKP